MSDPKRIIAQLKEELSTNPSVVAFILVGSHARKSIYTANQYSDMEAFIVTKDEEAEKVEGQLTKLVSKFGKVLFSFKHQIGFAAVYEDLFRLELPVVKQSNMGSVFNRPKAQEVKVLIDRTNGKLKEVLSKRPETIDYEHFFKDTIVNFWYWQICGVQYFKKGEFYNARVVLNIHASALIKLYELLNNPEVLLLETNKRVERFLTEEQLNQLKSVTLGYHKYEIKKALDIVMVIFPQVFNQIKNKYGYEYDESIEEKVKPKLSNKRFAFLKFMCYTVS